MNKDKCWVIGIQGSPSKLERWASWVRCEGSSFSFYFYFHGRDFFVPMNRRSNYFLKWRDVLWKESRNWEGRNSLIFPQRCLFSCLTCKIFCWESIHYESIHYGLASISVPVLWLLIHGTWRLNTATLLLSFVFTRYTMERPRFTDHLEAIKFICKDFWSELFKKQIDNLKTNHRVRSKAKPRSSRSFSCVLYLILHELDLNMENCFDSQGTFVLQDNRFRWLTRMSVDPQNESQDNSADGENKVAQATSMHLYFPCGIIRGALSNLGIPCAVSADISNLPACK